LDGNLSSPLQSERLLAWYNCAVRFLVAEEESYGWLDHPAS
jgi:hypothetical protein